MRLRTLGDDLDFSARSGGQHQQVHDRLCIDRFALAPDFHIAIKLAGDRDKLRGGPGVQASNIADGHALSGGAHSPAPSITSDATAIYRRPASAAVCASS